MFWEFSTELTVNQGLCRRTLFGPVTGKWIETDSWEPQTSGGPGPPVTIITLIVSLTQIHLPGKARVWIWLDPQSQAGESKKLRWVLVRGHNRSVSWPVKCHRDPLKALCEYVVKFRMLWSTHGNYCSVIKTETPRGVSHETLVFCFLGTFPHLNPMRVCWLFLFFFLLFFNFLVSTWHKLEWFGKMELYLRKQTYQIGPLDWSVVWEGPAHYGQCHYWAGGPGWCKKRKLSRGTSQQAAFFMASSSVLASRFLYSQPSQLLQALLFRPYLLENLTPLRQSPPCLDGSLRSVKNGGLPFSSGG